MPPLDVRLYAAFAAAPDGGNLAGVVYDPVGLPADSMQRLAVGLAAPTTGFVRPLGDGRFGVRFFSPRAEMAMCGHATVGVFAALVDDGHAGVGSYTQVTAAGELPITIERGSIGVRVTMRQPLPSFDLFDVPAARIAPSLGLAASDVKDIGSASTGLRHLLVEVPEAAILACIRPDDGALRALCREAGIDTVGVFARLEGAGGGADVRVRDFCHGVGDPEEAASGTTNGALAALLWRRGRLGAPRADGRVVVRAEQGVEMGRPSLVATELRVAGGKIAALRVGGSATRRLEGRLFL